MNTRSIIIRVAAVIIIAAYWLWPLDLMPANPIDDIIVTAVIGAAQQVAVKKISK